MVAKLSGVRYGTIAVPKAYLDAPADGLADAFRQDRADTGTVTGIVKFVDTANVEADLETVLTDCGDSSGSNAPNCINAGVNPLYLSERKSDARGTWLALPCVRTACLPLLAAQVSFSGDYATLSPARAFLRRRSCRCWRCGWAYVLLSAAFVVPLSLLEALGDRPPGLRADLVFRFPSQYLTDGDRVSGAASAGSGRAVSGLSLEQPPERDRAAEM